MALPVHNNLCELLLELQLVLRDPVGDLDCAAEALKWYLKSSEQGSVSALNGLAWIHATCPDPAYRDGAKAVDHALKACSNSPDEYAYVDTLAAAYARNGEFDKAVEVQREAILLVQQTYDDVPDRDGFPARLALYEKGQAYIEIEASTGTVSTGTVSMVADPE
jgi:TPR repeat protein